VTKVLIVEDEAHLAEGLRFNLQAEGYAVELTGDGESALKRLLESNGRFDAVVLDVMLPGIDGFEVVSSLRKAKNFIPVLILTARGRPEDVLEGFGAGADDYLSKPFELPIFLARLQGLLRRNEWLRSIKAAAPKATKEAASNSANERVKRFLLLEQALQRFFAFAGDDDGVAFGFEIEAEAFGEVRFVFNDENAAHTGSTRRLMRDRPSAGEW